MHLDVLQIHLRTITRIDVILLMLTAKFDYGGWEVGGGGGWGSYGNPRTKTRFSSDRSIVRGAFMKEQDTAEGTAVEECLQTTSRPSSLPNHWAKVLSHRWFRIIGQWPLVK